MNNESINNSQNIEELQLLGITLFRSNDNFSVLKEGELKMLEVNNLIDKDRVDFKMKYSDTVIFDKRLSDFLPINIVQSPKNLSSNYIMLSTIDQFDYDIPLISYLFDLLESNLFVWFTNFTVIGFIFYSLLLCVKSCFKVINILYFRIKNYMINDFSLNERSILFFILFFLLFGLLFFLYKWQLLTTCCLIGLVISLFISSLIKFQNTWDKFYKEGLLLELIKKVNPWLNKSFSIDIGDDKLNSSVYQYISCFLYLTSGLMFGRFFVLLSNSSNFTLNNNSLKSGIYLHSAFIIIILLLSLFMVYLDNALYYKKYKKNSLLLIASALFITSLIFIHFILFLGYSKLYSIICFPFLFFIVISDIIYTLLACDGVKDIFEECKSFIYNLFSKVNKYVISHGSYRLPKEIYNKSFVKPTFNPHYSPFRAGKGNNIISKVFDILFYSLGFFIKYCNRVVPYSFKLFIDPAKSYIKYPISFKHYQQLSVKLTGGSGIAPFIYNENNNNKSGVINNFISNTYIVLSHNQGSEGYDSHTSNSNYNNENSNSNQNKDTSNTGHLSTIRRSNFLVPPYPIRNDSISFAPPLEGYNVSFNNMQNSSNSTLWEGKEGFNPKNVPPTIVKSLDDSLESTFSKGTTKMEVSNFSGKRKRDLIDSTYSSVNSSKHISLSSLNNSLNPLVEAKLHLFPKNGSFEEKREFLQNVDPSLWDKYEYNPLRSEGLLCLQGNIEIGLDNALKEKYLEPCLIYGKNSLNSEELINNLNTYLSSFVPYLNNSGKDTSYAYKSLNSYIHGYQANQLTVAYSKMYEFILSLNIFDNVLTREGPLKIFKDYSSYVSFSDSKQQFIVNYRRYLYRGDNVAAPLWYKTLDSIGDLLSNHGLILFNCDYGDTYKNVRGKWVFNANTNDVVKYYNLCMANKEMIEVDHKKGKIIVCRLNNDEFSFLNHKLKKLGSELRKSIRRWCSRGIITDEDINNIIKEYDERYQYMLKLFAYRVAFVEYSVYNFVQKDLDVYKKNDYFSKYEDKIKKNLIADMCIEKYKIKEVFKKISIKDNNNKKVRVITNINLGREIL